MTKPTIQRFSEQSKGGAGADLVKEVWRRRKGLAIVVFSAVVAGAITVTLTLPDLYRATATGLVARQQVSEEFVRSAVTTEFETRIQTIHQQVMSRARLTDLATRLGLYPELREKRQFDAIVERLRADVDLDLTRVDPMSGRSPTIAFSVSYSGRNPQTVAQVANTLVASYIEENAKSRAQQSAQTAEFLKGQLADTKTELDAQERRTSEFKLRHGVELQEQFVSNLAALERLNTQLRLNGEYQIRVLERRERVEEQLADAASVQSATPPSATAETPLVRLKRELAELQRQFSDQYPDVIRLKGEIAALEQQVEPVGTNGHAVPAPVDTGARLKQTLATVDNELNSLKQQEAFLRQAIAGYESRVENAPKREQELQQLSLDYKTTKDRYETLLKRYEEAQLADSLEQGQNVEQFRILDPALPPGAPAAPNRPGLLVMGLIASLALAFGAVLAAEKLDTSFHSVDDLKAYVDVPTLATIRLIVTDGDMRRQRLRLALMAVLVVVGLALLVAGAYYVALENEQIVRRIPGGIR